MRPLPTTARVTWPVSQTAQAERDDASEGVSAGDSCPVLPANPDIRDDEEDCGLVIREGDIPDLENVPVSSR